MKKTSKKIKPPLLSNTLRERMLQEAQKALIAGHVNQARFYLDVALGPAKAEKVSDA